MTDEVDSQQPQQPAPRWQPLSPVDRRVAGVLVEKAKTTASTYPLSLNAVTTGCNQKSNRSPMMKLEPDDVQQSLDRLREIGAVGLIEGYGRVPKYRHYLYDWLGVDKVELAVMAELLLRGAQTVGELRSRAARMEPIRDLAELLPVLTSLESKGLVISLTRKGRGQVVTHALCSPGELDRIKAQYAAAEPPSAGARPAPPDEQRAGPMGVAMVDETPAEPRPVDAQTAEALRRAIDELRSQMAQLRSDLDDLAEAYGRTEDELRRLRRELGG